MKGYTVWFTGLSGSGKTTIANIVADRLRKRGIPIVILDGDRVRKTISRDLGYTKEERDKHITRIAEMCQILTENNVLNLACVVSPTKKIREYARSITKNFLEVYLKCPLDVCEKRDPQGHYKKARSGEITHFVGINVPYEEPENPEIILETDKAGAEESANKLIKELERMNVI